MVNIAVFVSGSGTNLQALIDACSNNEINGSIKLVISNRKKAYGLERARLAGIKAEWIKDEDLILKRLEEEKIDLIVLAGYLAIVSEKLISKFENKIINIHPSLIPSFCGEGFYGLHVHEACYKRGCKVSGATVHFVNEIPDGGEIILQKAVEIKEGDTPEVLQKRVMVEAEWNILPEAVSLFCQDRLTVENNIVHRGE